MRRRRREQIIRGGVLLALVTILAVCTGIFSSPVFAAEERNFDIQAGPADEAVRRFSEQAAMSVVYEAGRLDHFKTRALEGKYEPAEALRILLKGSGLTFSFPKKNQFSVNPEANESLPVLEGTSLPTVRIAAGASSNLRLVPGVTLQTITSEELVRQGFTTLSEWTRSLTQNQGTGANEGTSYLREAPTNIAYGSGMNLYGIGQRATLILVDGRRLAPSGSAGSFTDISNLPLSAIDHIELVSDGACTIYGADAVGGIVNFVLRDGYSGPLTSASFGHLTKGDLAANDFSQSIAKAGNRWRAMAAVDYYSRSGLPASDRSQATSDLISRGGINFNSAFGNPGNILDSEGRPWRIPPGQNGTSLTAAQLLPGLNTYDRDANTWILPEQVHLSAVASGSYDLSDSTTISLVSVLSRRKIATHLAPVSATLSVPSSNPYYVNPEPGNSLPVDVLYGFGKDFGPISERGTVDSGQFALGITHELGNGWHLQATETYAFDNQFETETNLVNFNALTKYLATTDPATAFNPFGDGSNTNAETLAAIRTDGSLEYRSAFETVNVEAVGSIPLLPAGPMTLTEGFENRIQTFRSTVSDGFNFAGQTLNTNRSRVLNAAYLQAAVPVLSGDFAPGSSYSLDLSGGWRYEHFNDAGSALTPSLGFSFALSSGIALTGSWARMFRPPNLADLDETSNYAAVSPVADPRSPSGYTQALVWGGNNGSLSAETAHSWMLGLQFSSAENPRLSWYAQYYNIVSSHQVLPGAPLLPLNLFSDPQYRYLFTRNVTPAALDDICSHSAFLGTLNQCESPGIGAIVDLRLRSAETLETDGLDLRGRYGRDTRIGELSLNMEATYVLHFDEALPPGAGLISYRSTPHNPIALRLHGLFGWESRQFFASAAVNLAGSYRDNISIPNRPVSAWTTWDLVIGYKLSSLDEVVGGDTTISMRGLNVFNKQPPLLFNFVGSEGFDPENADLLGRRISVRLVHRW